MNAGNAVGVTNSAGQFEIGDLKALQLPIYVRALGYETFERPQLELPPEPPPLVIELHPRK